MPAGDAQKLFKMCHTNFHVYDELPLKNGVSRRSIKVVFRTPAHSDKNGPSGYALLVENNLLIRPFPNGNSTSSRNFI